MRGKGEREEEEEEEEEEREGGGVSVRYGVPDAQALPRHCGGRGVHGPATTRATHRDEVEQRAEQRVGTRQQRVIRNYA